MLHEEQRHELLETLRHDSLWLASQGYYNYTLVIGIHRANPFDNQVFCGTIGLFCGNTGLFCVKKGTSEMSAIIVPICMTKRPRIILKETNIGLIRQKRLIPVPTPVTLRSLLSRYRALLRLYTTKQNYTRLKLYVCTGSATAQVQSVHIGLSVIYTCLFFLFSCLFSCISVSFIKYVGFFCHVFMSILSYI